MTPQQILNRVQEEADVRLDETIERLLFLLTTQSEQSRSEKYLYKWMQSGLLAKVRPDERAFASVLLEQRAKELVVEWSALRSDQQNSLWEAYAGKELKSAIHFLIDRDYQ